MKYAVIKTGAKQYKVTEGETLQIELLKATEKTVVFDEVLLVADGEQVQVGTPTVPDMTVTATVLGVVKGEKIEVFKYKSKSRYRKHTGHRQAYTAVKIESIGAPAKAAKAEATPKKATVKKVAAK
jgi:large subunit ribosomal protein L21